MSESTVSNRIPWPACGLFALAYGLVANSPMGPLVSETIRDHYSDSLLNQGIGLDAVVLLGAAPIAVVAGMLVLRGHRSGPVLALIPATLAA
ncbi:MAG TPA: hypothetical protein VFD97_08480 [Acidimicrobiia bacterium]|nr:hypothetical protein [Acidimicrobiia bacterium]